MRKKIIAVSTIALIILISTVVFAWFISTESIANKFKMGTIKVEVLEPGFEDITDVSTGTYTKNVQVASLGTKRTYVRIRLIPEWSEPSLPISNVQLNLNLGDWVDGGDGHYYYKYYLTKDQVTSLLLESVTFTSLGPEYDGKTLSIKAVAEGAQITHNAWKDIWGISTLPFPEGVPAP
ncbi:hypothetical protein KQI38_06875 [Tissierella carlieri]|jgi:predicted ribosomally synthesized peptide with SipW-like signal peptide|uniref:hypothetical protein n=1 Tax=Tissierella carlieri TaxID=689904 RepID=UPI001C11D932|nr:hypothetical protein [Tissierella carlieri]MBU5311747.1 hypothetical protein [Tissierella carlieri]MDU5080756.1 hypothetical protein [Bacillota bacterium]